MTTKKVVPVAILLFLFHKSFVVICQFGRMNQMHHILYCRSYEANKHKFRKMRNCFLDHTCSFDLCSCLFGQCVWTLRQRLIVVAGSFLSFLYVFWWASMRNRLKSFYYNNMFAIHFAGPSYRTISFTKFYGKVGHFCALWCDCWGKQVQRSFSYYRRSYNSFFKNWGTSLRLV